MLFRKGRLILHSLFFWRIYSFMAVGIRNEKVDILRGIAAVLMVLGHSFIVYRINISEVPWCAAVSHFIYTFHMELFFILAGVVYHCVCYKEYLKKKIKRIVVPYFIFIIIIISYIHPIIYVTRQILSDCIKCAPKIIFSRIGC